MDSEFSAFSNCSLFSFFRFALQFLHLLMLRLMLRLMLVFFMEAMDTVLVWAMLDLDTVLG